MNDVVEILYCNWRGETATRRIRPRAAWFGSTRWHPEPQWFIYAVDLDRSGDDEEITRDFAVCDIRTWTPLIGF